MAWDNTTWYVMAGISAVTLVALVSIVGGLIHYRRERLLLHAERMKALDLGLKAPEDAGTTRYKALLGIGQKGDDDEGSTGSKLANQCFTTTLWVAFWGFVFASQSTVGGNGVAYGIAASAGAIGVASVICGTVLAYKPPRTTAVKEPAYEEV
jgi:hypothetical protein